MTQVIHLSDPHFGTENHDVVPALLSTLHQLQPDLVVLSGDITQRARRHQFAAARDFLDRTALPWLAIPGNHDIPLFNLAARLFAPYANYRRALGHTLEPEWQSPHLLVLGVNSTRPHRHKHGELSASQIRRVAERLQSAGPDQLRIVTLHHPLRAVDPNDQQNLARGHAEACRAWRDAGVDLVLGGHIHLPYVVPLDATQPDSGWLAQAGTAVSTRVRGRIPNSFNRIVSSADQPRRCRVERHDFDAASGSFRVVTVNDATPLP